MRLHGHSHGSFSWRSLALCMAVLLVTAAAAAERANAPPGPASQASQASVPSPDEADYPYRTLPRDTLIGIGRRLLKDPARWREVQSRNAVRQPNRMPQGTLLRIPREWLRADVESAKVISLVGNATRDGVALQRGDTVAEGARLVTGSGSHLTLQLADGSTIDVDPDSSVTLGQLRRYSGTGRRDTLIEIQSGGAETQVKPQGDAGRFRIRTPVAVSAVRGTQFRRSIAADATDRTEVVGGRVAVSAARGTPGGVDVNEGYGTLADAGGPRPPVLLLPPPDLGAVPEPWSEGPLRVEFAPVPAAKEYRAQLATDADFHEILAEARGPSAPLAFDSQPDGRYWLRVRSVDGLGLAGRDAVREVHRHRLPDPPALQEPAEGASTRGTGLAVRWAPVTGAAGYRLQISTDADFGHPDIDRVLSDTQWHQDLAPGAWWWRASSRDAAGAAGPWSAARRFSLKAPPIEITQAQVTGRTPQLTWDAKPGQRFRLQVAHDARFEQIVADVPSAEPGRSLPPLEPGTYFTRLQATDADGEPGPWSGPRRIHVPLPWWAKAAPLLLVLPFL